MTTVGILYPGYSAEDDYPRAEEILDADARSAGAPRGGPRLPLVHTEMREDAHRVDALLDIGGDDVLAAGTKALQDGMGPAERFVEFLARAGVGVLALSARGIVTAAEVGTLPAADVLEFAEAADHPDADAVLLPDTALHTIGLLDQLDARVGKPVLTANQVSIWQGLRLAGAGGPRPGLGRLFVE